MTTIAKIGNLGLLAALALTGCAEPQQQSFYKAGATYEQQQKDEYECERDTRMAAPSFGVGAVGNYNAMDFAIRCMQVRGYSYGHFTRTADVSPQITTTPMQDAQGRTYAASDQVMCRYPTNDAPIKFNAGSCSYGGGTIIGPAN